MDMTVTLPFPPSTNHAYATVNGRRVKTAAARAYALEVAHRVREHARALTQAEQPPPDLTTERLAVKIVAHAPDNRRRDLSNLEKLATDAVFKQLGLDDSQVDHLEITRGVKSRNGGSLTYTLSLAPRTPF
jgi:crossover junction endodeoxyribonuclease RusA